MWNEIVQEMGIPWRWAESMHWQLGELELTKRGLSLFARDYQSGTVPVGFDAGLQAASLPSLQIPSSNDQDIIDESTPIQEKPSEKESFK